MKKITWIILLLGVALGAGVFVWVGAGHAFHAVLAIGWRGFGIILGWQLMVFAVLGVAWSLVCPGVATWITIWGRLVREGGETCLPFSEIGGLVFGGRAIMLFGADWAVTTASSVVDVAAEGVAEAPFVLFGLVMLLARKPGSPLLLPLGLGLGVICLGGAAAFFLRHRIAGWLRRGLTWVAKRFVKDAPDRADELEHKLEELFGRRRHFAGGCLVHLLSWFGGGFSIFLVYHLLGAKIGILPAMAIESMLSAVLSVGFLIPGGIGVQEASYVAIGALFGMPAHLSLALSLLRRARDIAIGAPSLVIWQVLEARGLKQPNAAQ